MRLDFDTYKDKMAGCWMGKNIGGVLGAPFEGKRGVFDVDFYVQELSGHPPANDDLDLQLVWLNAVEEYGSAINASILGEYWLSFIIPHWVEYGSAKNNLRMGIVPPLSGYLENPYRDSCGCFIRSELWACIAPGNPQIAAKYAYEDAIVDHSSEGMHAEVFCAALQSAAFVEKDFHQLIEIGLSYIPKDSGVTNAVRVALQAYQDGVDFKEARIRVLKAEQGSFGVQNLRLEKIPTELPPGKPGYDAPGNIGIMIIGLLYGENDFGKSICIANNCGEDTDCTCATLGALLGIINGRQAIPQKWVEPIGDYISTCCINRLEGGVQIPNTVTELTNRVLNLTPKFLKKGMCDFADWTNGYSIEVKEGKDLFCAGDQLYIEGISYYVVLEKGVSEFYRWGHHGVNYKFPAFEATLDYIDHPYIALNQPKKMRLNIKDSNKKLGDHNQKWVTVKWYTPEGVKVSPNTECCAFIQTLYKSEVNIDFEVLCEKSQGGKVELIIDISVNGRHSNGQIKVVLISSPQGGTT